MGKKPQSGTSKTKSLPPSWREKLAEYDINQIYEGRTCEIILMAELTISFSEAIVLFHVGANGNPTNVVKSVNLESLMNDIKQAKQVQAKPKAEKSKSKADPTVALFQSATAEALELLNTGQPISLELMAKLLKLKIITAINEDVTLRDAERILEIEQAELANEPQDKKGKAEKGKDAKKGKGKGKSAAIKLPIEERQLYFILSGFYEPPLIQDLCNIGITLTAILELASPECIMFKEKHAARSGTPRTSIPTLTGSFTSNSDGITEENDEEVVLFINQFYSTSKDSICFSAFGGDRSLSSVTSSIYEKMIGLTNFWNMIYKQLEGELQAKCFESAAHIRINPPSGTRADKNPQEIFLEISEEVLKIPDVKRQHLNYLNNVKICGTEVEAKDIPRTSWKTYNKLMDMVPSDCFTTALFLHCLVEEVCSRVPGPKPRRFIKTNSIPTECRKESKPFQEPPKSSADVKTQFEQNVSVESEGNLTLKKLANYVIQYKKTYTRLGRCGITYRQNVLDPKINLKISKEPFIMHETNWLEYKLNTYQELSKELLKINIDVLKKCPAALLWNLYPQLETIEVIYKNHQLQTWRHFLNLSIDDVKCALSAIQLDLLPCSMPAKYVGEAKNSLQARFPGKNESEVLQIATPNVKYIQTPDISLSTLNDKQSCLRIPQVPYSNNPNIYEAKNIPAYLWYEKLPPEVMLQELQRANCEFICADHKYCPYNDALILRYHDNVDMFGINWRIWTQSLRTPVCFRDFCKYILYDEAQWLEREEDNYQKKLKLLLKNPIPTEEINPETLQCQEAPIKKLSIQYAKPGEPYSFLAYDLSEARLQLTGATTIFHSMDGYKVTVDRTNFIGKPKNLSLNVAVAGHSFILHYNKTTLKEPLMFHFCLSDGSILVFAKPYRPNIPEISIAEKSKLPATNSNTHKTKHKLKPESAYQLREKNFYYVTEIKRWYLKSITVPTVVRQRSLLDQDLMFEFLEQIKKIFAGCSKKKTKRKFRRSRSPKCYTDELRTPVDPKEVFTLFVSPTVQNDLELTTSEDPKARAECNKVLKKIEEAKKLQIPMFKVYSSKLHKFEYIKRMKSYIYIKIGRHIISLPCKHPTYRTSRDVEVVKVFPVKLTDSLYYNNNSYDMKVSLPSGLLVYTLPGVNNQPFNIRQKYLEKNPHCRNIVNEDSRTFMRNGHVVVKKNDGTLDIFSASGQIIHCEIPHSTVHTHTKYKLKTKQKNGQGEQIKLTKLESKLCRIVNWRRRHIIGGTESRYFKYRRINLRQYKLQAKNSKEIYVMQKGSKPVFEFTLITHDGKQLKVTNTHIEKQNQIFQTTYQDEYYDEHINLRDDGTMSLIYGNGIFTTQFSDKTKISSWFAESPELILFEDEEDSFYGLSSMSSFFYEQLCDSGWVLVQMFYKFEHPNYATILYSGDNYETEINLPNNVIMNVTENGHYFVDIDKIVSSVINDELVYLESKSCDTCVQRSITVVNIKPLYDGMYPIEENSELLKTCDSYEKIFLVNYNGKCFRNSNFVKDRTNRVECHQHDKGDCQKLFVLNRDLTGRKFWDVKAYRKRIIEATENANTVLQYYGKNTREGDYSSLELRTYKYKPYHMCFINQNLSNNLIFSNSQSEPNPSLPAYTTLCHMHSMPKECMTKLLEASMMENNKQEAEFPKSDHQDTLCRCISQIGREKVKLNKKSVFDEHLTKISSAILLLKRWYTWHDLNKPYVPPTADRTCKCKSEPPQEKPQLIQSENIHKLSFDATEDTSLEIVPDRSASSSDIEPCKKAHKAVCDCDIPANFVCECKPRENVIEEETFPEVQTSLDFDSEGKRRISSIKGWSDEVNFLENFYVYAEESVSASEVEGASVSDTAIKKISVKPPPCKCNTDRKVNQRPLAPKRRSKQICTEDTCKKQKRQIASSKDSFEDSNTSLNNEAHERQAGGADSPPKFTNVRKYEATTIEKRNILKALQRKIIEIVLAASATGEVSAKRAEHYKIAVAIDIMSNISRAQLNISELTNFLQKLNEMDISKYKMLPAEQLSRLILSLSTRKIKDVGCKSTSSLNSTSKLFAEHKYQPSISKSTITTMQSMKHGQQLDKLKPINKKLRPQKQVIDKIPKARIK